MIGRRRLDRAGDLAPPQLASIALAERPIPVERFPHRDAEAELIGSRIDLQAAMLLGCHVARRADHAAGHRKGRLAGAARIRRARSGRRTRAGLGGLPVRRQVSGSSEPKIHDARTGVVTEQYVVGLEVAMDEPDLVRGRQPPPCLEIDGQNLAPAGTMLPNPASERPGRHELHGHEDPLVEQPHVVNR